jgi:hypothetical protein
MKAVTPIFPSSAACEVVYAKNQPEYEPLPAFRTQTCVVTRWKLSDDERRHIAGGGDLFICMMNFGRPILRFFLWPPIPRQSCRPLSKRRRISTGKAKKVSSVFCDSVVKSPNA